jgi:hypothetical protein
MSAPLSPFLTLMTALALAFSGCQKQDSNKAIPADVMQCLNDGCARSFPKRGESYFIKTPIGSKQEDAIIELRGLNPLPGVQTVPLSEAERLNGISERYLVTWGRATSIRAASANPEKSTGLEWTKWLDVATQPDRFSNELAEPVVGIIRQNGTLILTFFPQYHDESKESKASIKWMDQPTALTSAELELIGK